MTGGTARRYYLSNGTIYRVFRASGRGRRKISLSQVQNLRQPDKRGEYLANTHYGNRVSVGIGRLQVLVAALLFSTGGAGIKAAAFTALQVSALRSGIAALVLLLLRGLSTDRGTRMLVFSPATVATGVVYAATVTLFVLSTKLTTAANAIFLQATAPLYLLLLGPLILHERFRARDVLFLLGVAAGLVLCVIGQPEPTTTAPDPVRGNLLAVVCSITWALTLLGLRYIQRDQTETSAGLSAVTLGNLFASLAAWPFAWPLPAASIVEWSTIVYLGVCQIGLAYVFLTAAIRVLPALEVSLLLLIEPVLNPIWTWMIRAERPGAYTIIGGAIIVVATAIKSVYDARVTVATEVTKTG
jgi:drug/metabolite transporter, DME family